MDEIRQDHHRLYKAIGQLIRDVRTGKHITQADLAQAVSLSRSSITNIEKGRQKMLLHTLFDIARALGSEPAFLLPGPDRIDDHRDGKVPKDLSDKDRALIESAISRPKRGR